MVKVGDKVSWRHCWGSSPVADVYVKSLEVTDYPRDKDGDIVDEVSWDVVKQNRVIFTLSSGNWAYASQIAPLGKDPSIWHTL
jgi:hypothetical protein